MKAVLHYDALPSVRRMIEAAKSACFHVVAVKEADHEGLAREMCDADVLLHVLAPVTAQMMRSAPNLRLVQKVGVGVDAIDLDAARSRGVAVCNMPGTNTAAVAELTILLMLACLRRIVPIASDLKSHGMWPARASLLDGAGEIGGRTVGLIGFGAVAQRVARTLLVLGANVIAFDPATPKAVEGIESVPLDELIRRADIVSLHVPLTPETRNLLNEERLARMRPGAVVINTARGPLIDERALQAALTAGRLSAAGLDVFFDEPPRPDHPLLALDQVVAMPHVAWLTDETWRRSIDVIVENVRRLADGEVLKYRVA